MKYTWIEKKINHQTGNTYWVLHKGSRLFGKAFITGYEQDGITDDREVVEKWKQFYNANICVDTKWINKKKRRK